MSVVHGMSLVCVRSMNHESTVMEDQSPVPGVPPTAVFAMLVAVVCGGFAYEQSSVRPEDPAAGRTPESVVLAPQESAAATVILESMAFDGLAYMPLDAGADEEARM